jgi:hypothetical protein
MSPAGFASAIALTLTLAPCRGVLDLSAYQHPDGSIPIRAGGSVVDPYFPTKALIVAHEAGLDVRAPALAWIDWLRARQRPDGRFARYCGGPATWTVCGEEDADDSMLALWMQLLYTMSPSNRLSAEWMATAIAAESYLDTVRDPATGVYQISRAQPTSLFMDNVEVYAALRESAAAWRRYGDRRHADRLAGLADALALAIERTFRRSGRGDYSVSTQPRTDLAFYPDAVAQTYPWLTGFPSHQSGHRRQFQLWLRKYGKQWTSAKLDYPWGLVALTAAKVGERKAAMAWRRRAAPLRNTLRWNILEESAFQSLSMPLCSAGAPNRRTSTNW